MLRNFQSENLNDTKCLENLDLEGRIILKCMLDKCNASRWTRSVRPTTVPGRGMLLTQPITFQLHRMRRVKLDEYYRGADKFLVRPGRKQANASVRMA